MTHEELVIRVKLQEAVILGLIDCMRDLTAAVDTTNDAIGSHNSILGILLGVTPPEPKDET